MIKKKKAWVLELFCPKCGEPIYVYKDPLRVISQEVTCFECATIFLLRKDEKYNLEWKKGR